MLFYFRLNEGGYAEFNMASLINPDLEYPDTKVSQVNYISDNSIIICPSNTYLSSTNKCYLNPV